MAFQLNRLELCVVVSIHFLLWRVMIQYLISNFLYFFFCESKCMKRTLWKCLTRFDRREADKASLTKWILLGFGYWIFFFRVWFRICASFVDLKKKFLFGSKFSIIFVTFFRNWMLFAISFCMSHQPSYKIRRDLRGRIEEIYVKSKNV